MRINEAQLRLAKSTKIPKVDCETTATLDVSPQVVDPLTGLILYSGFRKVCMRHFDDSICDTVLLFLFLDADNLKQTNDSLGHEVGDQMIQKISNILVDNLPSNAIISRKGGDEFVVAVSCTNIDEAHSIPKLIHTAVNRAHTIAGYGIVLSCSIGASVRASCNIDLNKQEQEADTAMYWAKKCGKNQFKFYCEKECGEISMLRCLSLQFSGALSAGELSVAFQPIYRFADRHILGAEALIRWKHPEYGMVPATHIIDIATQSGKLLELGLFVLRTSCEVAMEWPEDRYISVNFAASDFSHKNFATCVLEILTAESCSPDRLKIEITEAEILDPTETVTSNIYALQKCGIKIGLDDFGTGYSSMGRIDCFPVDFIKIDRSLVAGCDQRISSKIFLSAIKTVAQKMRLELIAEGVETLQEGATVRGCGISSAQGFYFSQPISSYELLKFFQKPSDDVYLKV